MHIVYICNFIVCINFRWIRAIIRNSIENCTSCRDVDASTKAGSVGCDPKFAFACIAVKRNAFAQHLAQAIHELIKPRDGNSQRDLRIKKNKISKECNREKLRASGGLKDRSSKLPQKITSLRKSLSILTCHGTLATQIRPWSACKYDLNLETSDFPRYDRSHFRLHRP